MDIRLDFSLPEFQRIIWVNREAREVWEPRIQRISNAWNELERLAVVAGIKPATLQVCGPDTLPGLTRWALKHNLVCLPLSQQGSSESYTNGTPEFDPSKSWVYRVVIAGQSLAELFIRFWDEQDNDKIGASLGFPECCRKFFQRFWADENWRDLTFPMVLISDEDYNDYHRTPIRVSGPMECNILLRWLGLRLVSHLPCSFYCSSSQAIGKDMGLLGMRMFPQEMDWLTQILCWPVQWSSLHGVAIITTPIFRLVVDSTALASKIVIERDGSIYPEEGARSSVFPFQSTQKVVFRKKDDYTDNGFSSRIAMNLAHDVVLKAVDFALGSGGSGIDIGKVIDLGCGNGTLLEKIVSKTKWVVPCGVEQDSGKHQRAARRLLPFDPDLHLGNLFEENYWNPPYSIALLSINRLTEVGDEDIEGLLRRLRDGCHRLIVYSYDLAKDSTLELTSKFFKPLHVCSNESAVAHLLEPVNSNGEDSL